MAKKMMTASSSSVASKVPWIGREKSLRSSASATVTADAASSTQPASSASQRVPAAAARSSRRSPSITERSVRLPVLRGQRARLLQERLAGQAALVEVGRPLVVQAADGLAPALALLL